MESLSKILIDFPLYPQFWHLTWIHLDLLMDGRDMGGQKSVLKTKPALLGIAGNEGEEKQRLNLYSTGKELTYLEY